VLNHIDVVSGCICIFLVWDEARQKFVEKLLQLAVPVMVLVIVEPGKSKDVEPGPMRQDREKFHVLEVGRIAEGLAQLK
jgi:hypothetical protein